MIVMNSFNFAFRLNDVYYVQITLTGRSMLLFCLLAWKYSYIFTSEADPVVQPLLRRVGSFHVVSIRLGKAVHNIVC